MQQQDLIAGDSLNFAVSVSKYPPSSGWVLTYRLVPRNPGSLPIDFAASADGDEFVVAVPASTTAEWAPGAYTWASWVDKAGEQYTVTQGQITIQPNPRNAAAGYDGRSQARKALDDARTALAAWQPTQRRYKIGEREMEFRSTSEIIELISYWEIQVQREDRAARRAAGLPDPRRSFVRLNRG